MKASAHSTINVVGGEHDGAYVYTIEPLSIGSLRYLVASASDVEVLVVPYKWEHKHRARGEQLYHLLLKHGRLVFVPAPNQLHTTATKCS